MSEFFSSSFFVGIITTIISFEIAGVVSNRFKHPLANQYLLASIILVIIVRTLDITYDEYYNSAKYINYFATPATVCFAIPLYKQIKELKENLIPIFSSIVLGVFINISCVYLLSSILNTTNLEYFSMIPKHVTSPISVPLSAKYGGISTITILAVMVSGVGGNVMGESIIKLFRIKHHVSIGVALGSTSHAVGTAKALQMGETEGAMSGLAVAITGFITVFIGPVFTNIHF